MELAGVEPASKHGTNALSTCLVLLIFRDLPDAKQPNLSLVPVISPSGRNCLQAIPVLLAPPYRVGTGKFRRETSRPDLLVEIKLRLLYSPKQRERKYFRLLLFCDSV